MAYLCHQHAQSLTRAICRTDTRQKSILFIQELNFNPTSIGGGWDTAPLILWNRIILWHRAVLEFLQFLHSVHLATECAPAYPAPSHLLHAV